MRSQRPSRRRRRPCTTQRSPISGYWPPIGFLSTDGEPKRSLHPVVCGQTTTATCFRSSSKDRRDTGSMAQTMTQSNLGGPPPIAPELPPGGGGGEDRDRERP